MKKRSLIFTFSIVVSLLFGFAFPLFAQEGTGKPSNKAVNQKIRKLQIPFIANEGQADKKVAFYANTFGGTVFVTKEGEIVYALPKSANDNNRSLETGARIQKCRGELHSPDVIHDARQINDLHPPTHKSQPPISNKSLQGVALKETLVGAKVKGIKGEGKSVTKVNYFRGNDQEKWKSNISTYDVVDIGEVYKGIELKLKAYGNNVEKLFYVKPGANPDQIKINLGGIQPAASTAIRSMKETGVCPPLAGVGGGLIAKELYVNEQGQLVAETELGPVTFTKPVAYQEIEGKRVDVAVEYEIYAVPQVVHRKDAKKAKENIVVNTVSAGNVCPPLAGVKGVERDSPHVIQPTTNPKSKIVNLSSTEIGNTKLEYGFKVASYNKTKELVIDPLLASTYLGGQDDDRGRYLTLDASGNVYVTGLTSSSDFPTTVGAYDTSFNSSSYNVFVSKLDSKLTRLLASTYLGIAGPTDSGPSIALDASGNVYVTGFTSSSDFPTTVGAYDTSRNAYDIFVSKLDGRLTSLLASTYLGGSSDDYGKSIALDAGGNVYVTGHTSSTNFPTTDGAYDTSSDKYYSDVFVSKLDSGLTSLLASTYLSGSSNDYSHSLALDTSGNVYVTGWTKSSNFPTTAGAYDTTYNGDYDVFVSKLDSDLMSLLASTYLGYSGYDYGYSLALDASGNVYVTGLTSSSDFPTTVGAYDTSGNYNGDYDVFISKLNSGLTSLLASTCLGGSDSDGGRSLALDVSGSVSVMGNTKSSDFPTMVGAHDTSFNGGDYDIFISKLDGDLSATSVSIYGMVVDTEDYPVESARVTLKGKRKNAKVKEKSTTDEAGAYEFTELDNGTYIIQAKKKGYKKAKERIKLSGGEDKEVDLLLEEKKKK
ncbi:SBBP repeat-containing protein [uncultured Candidatus Kuenenia sp.]|uniref:SBBP repeat-containing protein n=1 Tax=uncultured Candidatus Kuenenia sp. TaxID=1048336 RepID=UPI0025FDDFE2|nr:SBBP repeat-containing protein [uncultured Candidatus Kuenenia sp.]